MGERLKINLCHKITLVYGGIYFNLFFLFPLLKSYYEKSYPNRHLSLSTWDTNAPQSQQSTSQE